MDTKTDFKKFFKSLGFTLIELLVVLSILMILASLLLPALKKAREKTYCAICSNNLKNLHVSEIAYVNDANGYFTPTYPGRDENDDWAFYWTNLVFPYLGGNGTSTQEFRSKVDPENSVYFCPMQRPNDTPKGGSTNDYPSYALNVSFGGRDKTVPEAGKLVAVTRPSVVAMFADVQYTPSEPNKGFRYLTAYYFSSRHPKTANGSCNIAWTDGHVSKVETQWAKDNAYTSGEDILDYKNFQYNW
jgi:prepilin-type N-terminal cleavage/methylation domain-containing protein/prepilin-type processing-associated H-X9-DG protein